MNANINRRDPLTLQAIAAAGIDARQAGDCYDRIINLIQHPEANRLRVVLHGAEQGRR